MKKLFSILAMILLMSVVFVACAPAQKTPETKDESNVQQEEKTDKKEEPKADATGLTGKLKEIKDRGKLIVATSADYPPYEFHAMIDGKDEFVGFDMDLARAIAEAMGVELEIQDMGFDAALGSVTTGMADLSIAGIGRRPEREPMFEFSEVYHNSEQGVLVRKEDVEKYKSEADFKGKILGAQIGTIQEGIARGIEGAEVKVLSKLTNMIVELKTGLVDAVVIELPVGKSYAVQNPDLAVAESITFPSEGEGSCVIANKGETALMEEVNKIIADLKESGKMNEFVVKAYEMVGATGE